MHLLGAARQMANLKFVAASEHSAVGFRFIERLQFVTKTDARCALEPIGI